MSAFARSARARSLLGVLAVALWFLYVSLGWAVAPAACSTSGFHLGSAGLMVVSIAGLAWAAWGGDAGARSGTGSAPAHFGRVMWLRIGALFAVGTATAWALTALWC